MEGKKLLTAFIGELFSILFFLSPCDINLLSFISLKALTSQLFLSLTSSFIQKLTFYRFPICNAHTHTRAEAPQNMAPQSSQKSIMEMSVDRGSKIHLPCNIQGSPLPVYTWYRLSDSSSFYSVPSSQRIIPSQTLLLIRNVEERDAGRWVSFNFIEHQTLTNFPL